MIDDGRTVRMGAIRDLTFQKELEAERQRHRESLFNAHRHACMGSMGAIVAHQVNQPLTRINILLDRAIEQLERENSCPDALKNTKEGFAQAQEAAGLIRKFRKYSKGFTSSGLVNVNVAKVAKKVVSALSATLASGRIHFETQGLSELPEIEANETALEQMFLVFIQNSLDALDDDGKHWLRIVGKPCDENIELRFMDDGCGIAPENLEKIFEPFFSTKSPETAMGLGLDIVQQIIISYGGNISVESELNKGATFCITLPVSNA